MRPCLSLLCLAAAAACAAASDAAPADAPPDAAPASVTPPIDAEALVVRDDLFEDGSWWEPYVPSLGGVIDAELDGAPPAERLVLTVHPVPEAAAELRIHPYRHDGADWRALPRLQAGGYMEMGYVQPIDLEGDGQQELLLVGDTDGSVPADLSVVRWDGARFRELVWGVDPAPAYAVGDVDGDGAQEIVGLPGEYGGGLVVLGLAADGFLRAEPLGDPTAWLPRLADTAVRAWPPPKHVVEGLGLAMTAMGVVPSTHTVREILGRWDATPAWTRGDFAPLLALHAEGRRFLTALLDERAQGAPLHAAARALAASEDPASHRRVLIAIEAAAARDADAARAIAEGGAYGFADRDDPRLIDLAARLVRDPAVDAELREDLVFWVLPLHPRGAKALRDLVGSDDAGLAAAAAKGINRCAGPFAPDPTLFRMVLDADLGRRLLDAEAPELRDAGLSLLVAHEALPSEADLLRRALAEDDVSLRRRIVGALPRAGPSGVDTGATALFGLERGVRHSTHFWYAASDTPDVWLEGLGAVAHDDDLQPYSSRMLGWGPLGPEWHLVRDTALAWSEDERGRMRQRASELLGAFPDPESHSALAALLHDQIDWVQTTAARQLARHQTQAAADALADVLGGLVELDPQPRYRIGEVMRALAETRQPTALAALEALGPWDEAALYALEHGGQGGGQALARILDRLLASAGQDCQALTRTATSLARVTPALAVPRAKQVRRRCGDDWLPLLIEAYERSDALEPVGAFVDHGDRRVRVAAMEARGRLLRDYAIPR